jgi:predicted transcriptional regulator
MDDHSAGVYRPQLSVDRDFTVIPNSWIRNAGLSPSANYLLIYLMTHEIGYEITFSQMQRETGLGIKGVRAALAELQSKNWLAMERTKKVNGQLGPYRYTLTDSTVPQGTVVAGTVAQGTDNKKNNYKEEQSKEIDSLFDEFWNAYPRKLDKAKAFRAFKSALKRTKFEDILAGVIAYRNDPARNPDFTKYPATWLNNDSWENAAGSGASPHSERNAKEREVSAQYLAELKEREKLAAPPPKCEHGKNPALCLPCSKSLG